MTRRLRLAASALALFVASAASAAPRAAQNPGQPAGAVRSAAPRAQPPAVRTVTESQDARETRDELQQMLHRYSPALGGVFKLDPSLMSNSDYLAPYPGLADFLGRHPEIARDPAYFLENVDLPWDPWRRNQPMDPRQEMVNLWRNTIDGVMIFLGFAVVLSALIWLIKTLVDYRRWSRLAKVQTDVHGKLLDRFANNDELMAYVQTPAGRRFLESAPILLDPAAPAVAAPLRRIMWSLEAGCVLMAGGIGLQFVSGRSPAEVSPMLFAIGVLGLALGLGFIVAAGVSFFISKRLGLLQPAAEPPRGVAS